MCEAWVPSPVPKKRFFFLKKLCLSCEKDSVAKKAKDAFKQHLLPTEFSQLDFCAAHTGEFLVGGFG